MEKRTVKNYCKLFLNQDAFTGHNIWILKATGYNRGRGIYVFDTIEKLKTYIKQMDEGIVLTEGQPPPVTSPKNDESFMREGKEEEGRLS